MSITIATLTALIAVGVLVYRGGLIAWVGLFLAIGLLAKVVLRPSGNELGLSIVLALGSAIAWAGAWYYVISTYESGEVVELAIDTGDGESHTARLWVFELAGDPTVYFDANPRAAESLLAGRPLSFTRDGVTSTLTPNARKAESLTEQEVSAAFAAMGSKYGERMRAADIYYVLLGLPRNRTSLVVRLLDG